MTPPDMTPPVPTLEEMAKLEAKATPGTWQCRRVVYDAEPPRYDDEEFLTVSRQVVDDEQAMLCEVVAANGAVATMADDVGHDGRFTAASRAFVPWAIARIRELETENAILQRFASEVADALKSGLLRSTRASVDVLLRLPSEELAKLNGGSEVKP